DDAGEGRSWGLDLHWVPLVATGDFSIARRFDDAHHNYIEFQRLVSRDLLRILRSPSPRARRSSMDWSTPHVRTSTQKCFFCSRGRGRFFPTARSLGDFRFLALPARIAPDHPHQQHPCPPLAVSGPERGDGRRRGVAGPGDEA